MRVTIADNSVTVDGRRIALDLSGFECFAGLHAVTAQTDRDRAEIEYSEIDPDGPGPLKSHKPDNKLIDASTFFATFGGIIEAAGRVRDVPDVHRKKERAETRQRSPENLEMIEALATDCARLAEENETLKAAVSDLSGRLSGVEAFRDAMGSEALRVTKEAAP